MQDLRLRLKQIETRNEEDEKAIEDAIEFINKVAEYGAKQKAVFELLGYVRKEDLIGVNNNDKN